MQIQDLIDVLRVTRDNFKQSYNESKKKREDNEKEVEKNYEHTSQTYFNKKQKIESIFCEEVENYKRSAMANVEEQFAKIRKEESEKVNVIDDLNINKLLAVSHLPITSEELMVLNNNLGYQHNYWTSRIIASIAEENGIFIQTIINGSLYSNKLAVLTELEAQFYELLRVYNGNYEEKIEMLLSDSILHESKAKYIGCFDTVKYNQRAYKAYTLVSSKNNEMSKAIVLHNVIKTADKLTKCEFIMRILKDNAVSPTVIIKSGCKTEIDNFKNQQLQQYKDAKEIVEQAKVAKTLEEISAVVSDNIFANEYVKEILKEESLNNKTIEEYLLNNKVIGE